MSGRWVLLEGGTAAPAAAAEWDACRDRLGRSVDVVVRTAAGSTVHYERDAPAELADRMAAALADGDAPVLATGPGPHAHHSGDAALRQAVDLLPLDAAGWVIGSFAHAAALTRLVRRRPAVRCLIGPPLLAALGDPRPSEEADRLAGAVVTAWRDGPPDGPVAPLPAVVGHPGPRHLPLGSRPAEPPPFRCLSPGVVRGRVWAGPMLPLALELEADPLDEDAVVFVEPGVMAEAFLDVILGGASAPQVRALAAGVPPWPIEPVVGHFTMVRRMFDGRPLVGSVGGFAGTGVPAPLLELGRWAEVDVSPAGVVVRWEPPGRVDG